MKITEFGYPRAALIGNPSDGYFGKTIAFVFDEFRAAVTIVPFDTILFEPNNVDTNHYEGQTEFELHLQKHGYYGGIRLLKATFKCFIKYCRDSGQQISNRGFSMSYQSDIPVRLGFAGSSAIITAAMKALCRYYHIIIPPHLLANVVLSVEQDELNIEGGLQDRVAQAYEQPVNMDFEESKMKADGYGTYSTIDKGLLPTLYIAYKESSAEGSENTHNNLRERFLKKEPLVIEAMKKFRRLTDEFYKAINSGDTESAAQLIDQNFDLRRSIMPIMDQHVKMINIARSVGASAKFTGSGGAIIGTYQGEEMFGRLKKDFENHNIKCLKPNIVGG